MSPLEMVCKLLDDGILFKLNYIDKKSVKKIVYLMKGDWINHIDPDKNVKENKIYDICLNKEFNLNKISIEGITYIIFPENISLEEIRTSKNLYLKQDTIYVNFLKEQYDILLNLLPSLYSQVLLNFDNLNNDEIYDICILRFYPKKIKKTKNVYEKIKKDIADKFFMADNQTTEIDSPYSSIDAFKIFGIDDKNIDVSDKDFVNALKRKWFSLIENHKKHIIENFKNADVTFLKTEEKKEYDEEISLFNDELDKITIKDLVEMKTAKDVIKYWPLILQPKPNFVYGD